MSQSIELLGAYVGVPSAQTLHTTHYTFCTLCTAQSVPHPYRIQNTHYAGYLVLRTLHAAHCALCALHTAHCALCTLYTGCLSCLLCTPVSVICTTHCYCTPYTSCTLYSAQCTVCACAACRLHPARSAHRKLCTLQIVLPERAPWCGHKQSRSPGGVWHWRCRTTAECFQLCCRRVQRPWCGKCSNNLVFRLDVVRTQINWVPRFRAMDLGHEVGELGGWCDVSCNNAGDICENWM